MAKVLQHPHYYAHRFVPIHRSNYTAGRDGNKPQFVVLHIMQGTYAGSISWAQNPQSNVSWTYAVARDGHTTQNLGEHQTAWTNSSWWHNIRSVTLEHEGFLSHGGPTEAQLHASAKITAGICYRHGIPIDRAHIFGHTEIKGVSKPCPGPWPWAKYIALVKRYSGKGTPVKPAPSQPASTPVAPKMVYFAPGSGGPANTLADAGVRALRSAGVNAHKCTDKADHDWALKKAIEGKLGEYPYIIVGPAGWDMTDQAKTANSGEPGDWLPRNRTDIWAAIYSGDYAGRRSAVETHVGVAANRAGKDGAKARRRFRESLGESLGKADGGGSPPDEGADMRTSYPRERITARINFDAWMPAAERAAREVSDKFQPRSLNSYPGHGGEPRDALAKGNSTSVDYFVCPWTHRPSKAQGQKRIAMAKYVIKHRKRMPVKYAISGGYIWTHKRRRWVKYDPSFYNLWHPKDNYWSKMHFEHLHVTYLWD